MMPNRDKIESHCNLVDYWKPREQQVKTQIIISFIILIWQKFNHITYRTIIDYNLMYSWTYSWVPFMTLAHTWTSARCLCNKSTHHDAHKCSGWCSRIQIPLIKLAVVCVFINYCLKYFGEIFRNKKWTLW